MNHKCLITDEISMANGKGKVLWRFLDSKNPDAQQVICDPCYKWSEERDDFTNFRPRALTQRNTGETRVCSNPNCRDTDEQCAARGKKLRWSRIEDDWYCEPCYQYNHRKGEHRGPGAVVRQRLGQDSSSNVCSNIHCQDTNAQSVERGGQPLKWNYVNSVVESGDNRLLCRPCNEYTNAVDSRGNGTAKPYPAHIVAARRQEEVRHHQQQLEQA